MTEPVQVHEVLILLRDVFVVVALLRQKSSMLHMDSLIYKD